MVLVAATGAALGGPSVPAPGSAEAHSPGVGVLVDWGFYSDAQRYKQSHLHDRSQRPRHCFGTISELLNAV